MRFTFWIYVFLLVPFFEIGAQNTAPSVLSEAPFSIGETVSLHSEILKENRTLNVYLPNGYSENSDKNYPVIYLLDGSADEDFIHVAGLVQFASFPWIQIIPETIVVGIANVDRKRDFTYPTNNAKDKADFPTTGHSAEFIDFLEKELQPFVKNRYRISDQSTLIGQSLGGLLASEILYEKPHLFHNYIIVSPSLWWDDESLLDRTPKDFLPERKIYIAVGKEGPIMERMARSLHTDLLKLATREQQLENTLYFSYLEEQDHGDTLHLAVYDAFEKLFPKKEN